MSEKITLISFALCPYVQRAVIMLNEKGVAFERINIDLANKPEWFLQISPQGKVPVLKVGDEVLFESAAIVEYLDEVYGPRLHPHDPIARARHRAWMEFGSAVLSDNWTIATAKTQEAFDAAVTAVRTKLTRLEGELGKGPWFAGEHFSLVDAIFAPAFRYCELFEQLAELDIMEGLPRLRAWRDALLARNSVVNAAPIDFTDGVKAFMPRFGGLLAEKAQAA